MTPFNAGRKWNRFRFTDVAVVPLCYLIIHSNTPVCAAPRGRVFNKALLSPVFGIRNMTSPSPSPEAQTPDISGQIRLRAGNEPAPSHTSPNHAMKPFPAVIRCSPLLSDAKQTPPPSLFLSLLFYFLITSNLSPLPSHGETKSRRNRDRGSPACPTKFSRGPIT